MGNPLIWLSGAQRDILARHRADRPKYVGIGSAVLITAAMAGVSMTFALHSALRIGLGEAIPFAIAWGIAIMSLDRWLVVSLVRQPSKWNYLWLALPRVLLGILFGLIISTPFTLQIFEPEINQQITVIQQQRADAYYKNLANDPLTRKIKADQAQVNNYEQIISAGGGTGLNPAQDPTVQSLTQQLNQATSQATTDYNKWHCEMYGFPGHCVVGDGPAAKADYAAYTHDENVISADNAKLQAVEQQILGQDKSAAANNLANAQKDLGPAKAKLAADQHEQTELEDSFNTTNASNAGLLLRLQALDEVAASNGTLQAARWLLFLFFTAIECLPILVKTLLNLGPENSYEKALAQAEQASLRLSEHETMRQYRDELMAGDEESERLQANWQGRLPRLIDAATDARERVALSRISAWEREASAGPGGFQPDGLRRLSGMSATDRMPGTDWMRTRRKPRANGKRTSSRLLAAWHAFRRTDTPQPQFGRQSPPPPQSAAEQFWPN